MDVDNIDSMRRFSEEFPEVEMGKLPSEVWESAKSGGSLTEAYLRWENKRLRGEAEAAVVNRSARERSAGSRACAGGAEPEDEFARWLDM